jgi:predicted lipoprotein with Yx(FWY)xxD motif
MSFHAIHRSTAVGRRRAAFAAAAVAAALAGSLAAVAIGSSASFTLGSATNATLSETVLVNGAGRTLYALSPETTHHLLCRSGECLSLWPPLTVRNRHVKLRRGAGVHGTLALLHRSNGAWQVTLRGKPLYRFAGDEARGQANGQGIQSFGGTWHAVTASTSTQTPTTTTTTTTTTPPPEHPYSY